MSITRGPAPSIVAAAALLVAGVAAAVLAHDYDRETQDLIASLHRHRAIHAALVALLDGDAASEALFVGDEASPVALPEVRWSEHDAARGALETALAGLTSPTEHAVLMAAVVARDAWTERLVTLARGGELDAARALVRTGEGARLRRAVRQELERLEALEDDRVSALVESVAARRARTSVALVVSGLVALTVVLALLVRAWRDARASSARARVAEENERRVRQLAESAVDLVRLFDARGHTLYVSPSAERLLRRTPEEVQRAGDSELVPAEDRSALEDAVDRMRRGETPPAVLHRLRRADGTLVWFETRIEPVHDEQGDLVRWQAASRDVDERVRRDHARDARVSSLVEEAAELREASHTDALTGLLNRRGLFERAAAVLESERAAGHTTAVVFADVDGLKEVNDRLGHDAGDQLIRAAAEVLRAVARDGDLVARLGGDELVVVARGCDAAGATALVARLRDALEKGAADRPFALSLSLGHALALPSEPRALDDLVAEADARMYENKRGRRAPSTGAPAAE